MSLVPRFVYGALDLTEWPFAVEFGSDFGNPENVVDVVASMMADGEVLEVNRRTNRTLTIPILCDEADLQALAEAEALLIAEADKPRNTLSVDPGDGIGATTMFDTFRAQPRWIRNDDEEQNGVRRIVLEIPALPHSHSVDPFTDDADTPASTGTIEDACEDATGWSSPAGAAAPVVDSVLFAEGTGSVKCEAYQLSRIPAGSGSATAYFEACNRDTVSGLSIATGAGGYLSLLVRMDWPSGAGGDNRSEVTAIRQTTTGSPAPVAFAAVETVDQNFVRYVWPVAAGLTVTALEVSVTQRRSDQPSTPDTPFVRYDSITLAAAATTDQQIVKTFDVPGSARGPGSLYIASPSDSVALGKVLAITANEAAVPAGFRPDGRRWVVSGTATGTGAPIYGSYFAAGSNPIFDVPVSMLAHGPHTIVGLVKSGADPLNVTVTAQLRLGGTNVGAIETVSQSVENLSNVWRFVVLGTIYLPPMPMLNPDSDAFVRVEFSDGMNLDEFYMIPEVADFSLVDCGASTVSAAGSSSHLWIDSPDAEQPRGGWWRGPSPDRSNARSAWADVAKHGRHIYSPGRCVAWVTTTNAQGPRVTLSGNAWWFGNAAS